ncbi:MAG: hypothetical protein ABI689_14715 [Thermoanaerobaculia bacterium]
MHNSPIGQNSKAVAAPNSTESTSNSRTSCRRCVLGALIGFCAATAALAQGQPRPITGELQVNQLVTGDQRAPEVAMSDDGTHRIVWQSDGQDGSGQAIVSRRFPGDGSEPFNESVLNQSTVGDQSNPGIGMNAGGDWIAVWKTSAAGAKIRGRASSNNGSTLGNEFAVSQAATATGLPAASRAIDDSFVAVWEDPGTFRPFDAASQPITGDLDLAPALGNLFSPRVASTPVGGFVTVLYANDSDNFGVFARRFDSGGDPVGELIGLSESEESAQTDPAVDSAADGSFVAAWRDGVLGARVRCFTAAGVPRGGEIPLDPSNSVPRVAVSPGGAFVVTLAPVLGEVLAFEFDRTCRPVGTSFQVNTTTNGSQNSVAAAAGSDRFVIVWQSANLDGNLLAVARRLYRFRSIFADDFESGDELAWSASVP